MTHTPDTPNSGIDDNPQIQNNPNEAVNLTSRRRFLAQATAVGGLAAAAVALRSGALDGVGRLTEPSGSAGIDPSVGAADSVTQAAEQAGRLLPGAVEDRVLVVVDLSGGNDGLSTLVPAGDAAYYDARPSLAIPQDEVLWLDDDVGLHPSLARLHQRGITTVEGIGPINGDLSHFSMVERWQRGDVRGTQPARSGFLGRLTDALDDGRPLVGVALGSSSPHLLNHQAGTMTLSRADDLWFMAPADGGERWAYQHGMNLFPVDGDLNATIAAGHRQIRDLGYRLAEADEALSRSAEGTADDDPMLSEGGYLGHLLHLAGDLIAAGTGTRIFYTSFGDFDTHDNHQWRQSDNLARLDAAVDGFLRRANDGGYGDKVAVATVSEFGRRVGENDGGLDHGTSSVAMVARPGGPSLHLGERPSLTDLDNNDNLKVPIGFDRYLASLAQEWLGVEAASVLPDSPEPLGLFV